MPATTRASTSKKTPNEASLSPIMDSSSTASSRDSTLLDTSTPLIQAPVDHFKFLLTTITENQKKLEENQQNIQAMQVHLDRYHVTLETNTKDVTTLIQKVDVLKFAVNNTIPADFCVAIDEATATLRSDFTTSLTNARLIGTACADLKLVPAWLLLGPKATEQANLLILFFFPFLPTTSTHSPELKFADLSRHPWNLPKQP